MKKKKDCGFLLFRDLWEERKDLTCSILFSPVNIFKTGAVPSRTKKKHLQRAWYPLLGSLRKDFFEGHTSTGSEAFSLYICVERYQMRMQSPLTFIETICLDIWA